MILYIVRHGDPDYENDSLTELGKRQAEALVKRFSVHGLDRIYTSPLGRAKMTAEPTYKALGITPKVLDWLSEDEAFKDLSVARQGGGRTWSFGSCRNTEYLLKEEALTDDGWYGIYPFSECRPKRAVERIARGSDELLTELGYERDGKVYNVVAPSEEKVAVFCHYGAGTTWIAHLLSLPAPLVWGKFLINHSSITVMRFPNDKEGFIIPMCLALSDCSHIHEAGLPHTFENWIEY